MAPVQLGALIRAEGLDLDDPDQRRRVTRRLAYKVLGGIAEAGEVDASGLVAGVLLASEERALSREEITSRCRKLAEAASTSVRLSEELKDDLEQSVRDTLRFCAQRVDSAFPAWLVACLRTYAVSWCTCVIRAFTLCLRRPAPALRGA